MFLRRFFLAAAISVSFCVFLPASGQDASPAITEQKSDSAVWTPARLEHTFGGEDPLTSWNHAMFTTNDFLMHYLVRPIGIGYTTIIPKPVIDILENMCRNLEFPRKAITCIGTAEWRGAGDETARFLLNTTVGIAGMFDPATHWFHFYSTESDFGRMFAVWGIEPGCTFMLPLCSFVNVRDGVGALFDYAFDLRTYIPYSSWSWLNRAVVLEKDYSGAMDNASDRYHMFRTAMIARRELANKLWFYHAANEAYRAAKERTVFSKGIPAEPPAQSVTGVPSPVRIPGYSTQGALTDTVRALRFQPQASGDFWWMRLSAFNRDFSKLCETRETELIPNKPYAYLYRAPDSEKVNRNAPETLVFILPGIGTHKNTASPLAMAEIFHNEGCHIAIVDSAFTGEFTVRAAHGKLPGYAPRDAMHMRDLLCRIADDLKASGTLPANAEIRVAGWSFGAVHALHMAHLEETDAKLNAVRYLAIQPPADLNFALEKADELAEVSRHWTPSQARDILIDTVGKALIMNDAVLPPDNGIRKGPNPYAVALTEEQSRFLIAFSLRAGIRDVLLERHADTPVPGIRHGIQMENRIALLEELDALPFRTYVKQCLMADNSFPQQKDGGYAKLAADAGLRAIEKTVRNNPRIRILHVADDFLLNEADRIWLTETAGKKLVWLDRGGHLGSLYTIQAQTELRRLLFEKE